MLQFPHLGSRDGDSCHEVHISSCVGSPQSSAGHRERALEAFVIVPSPRLTSQPQIGGPHHLLSVLLGCPLGTWSFPCLNQSLAFCFSLFLPSLCLHPNLFLSQFSVSGTGLCAPLTTPEEFFDPSLLASCQCYHPNWMCLSLPAYTAALAACLVFLHSASCNCLGPAASMVRLSSVENLR